jgi:exonuclease SbcC
VIYPDRQQTLDWLAAEMGIPRKSSKDDYLTTLFDGAIGVPQGAMTGVFLASAGVRQKEFGALLRVDEYRTAYEKLSGTAQSLAGQLALVDHEIALKQGELVRLPGLLQELAELNEQLADLTDRLPFERQRLADADAFVATCEGLLSAVQAAEHELELAEGRLTVVGENVTRAAAELAEAERTVRACTESSEGYRIYEAARQAQSNLDARRKERDRRSGLLNKTKQDQAAAQAQLRETEDGLTRVAAAERRILELDPLVKEQERYEAAQREAEQRATKYQSALTEVRRCQDRIRTVLQNLPRIEREVQQREQLGQQLAQLHESRRQKAAEIAGRENSISQLRTDYETERDALRELERQEQSLTYEREQLEKENAAMARLRGELELVRAGLQERARIQTELRTLGETMQRQRAAQAAARNETNRCAEALQTLEKRLQALDGKDVPECPICQHPLTPAHARQIITESKAEKARLNEGQKAALAAERQASGQIESLQTQERKLQQELEPLPSPTRVGEIERDIAAHETAAQNHTGQIRRLSGIPKKHIDQKAIVDDIKVRGTTLAAQQSAAKKALDALDGEITDLTGKMNPLAQPGRIKELRDEAEEQELQK